MVFPKGSQRWQLKYFLVKINVVMSKSKNVLLA